MYGSIGVPELILVVFGIGGGLFWLWMLVDCASNEKAEYRVGWILVLVLANVFGAVAYFFLRRQQRLAHPRPNRAIPGDRDPRERGSRPLNSNR